MAAQDAASNAAADVAGTVGEVGGFAAKAIDWAVTKGPGLAVQFVIFLAILIIGFWIAKKLAATTKKLAMKSPNVDETLANFLSSIVGYVIKICLLYTSPSPRDLSTSRMPSSA